jgi:hypothetical protein
MGGEDSEDEFSGYSCIILCSMPAANSATAVRRVWASSEYHIFSFVESSTRTFKLTHLRKAIFVQSGPLFLRIISSEILVVTYGNFKSNKAKLQKLQIKRISGFHNGYYEEYRLLGCSAV